MNNIEKAFGVLDDRDEYSCSFSESIKYYTNEGKTDGNGAYFLFNSFDNKDCTLITLRNIIKTNDDK